MSVTNWNPKKSLGSVTAVSPVPTVQPFGATPILNTVVLATPPDRLMAVLVAEPSKPHAKHGSVRLTFRIRLLRR